MVSAWQTIRANWNRTDILVIAFNVAAGFAYLGNCWWDSIEVCYAAALIPIFVQSVWCLRTSDRTLRDALLIGLGLGIAWPIGEGITVNTLGWWGDYTASGPYIWHTAAYCVLIGWLATAHIVYLTSRSLSMGFSHWTAAAVGGVSAFVVGIAGENFFVAADMWTYRETAWQFWSIPAFLPIAYGLGYAVLPMFQQRPVAIRLATLLGWLFITCTGLGIATGFFPE